MATYKVVDADQLNADMTSVADSIRTKGGTTEALAWPDGYKTAIDSIPAGSAPSLQSKSVTYTANGTNTVTADDGYDGLISVDVTVNVSGGGGVETATLKVVAGGIPMWSYSVFATGIDGVFEITGFGTYDVVKNSMLFLYGSAMNIENLTEIFSDDYIRVYEVTGNAQLDLS